MNTAFPSKLLLLGEYTIIKGSQALAIPFPVYSGQFQYGGDAQNLLDFCSDLEKKQEEGTLLCELDLGAFRAALGKGLNFESSIPTGYGAGSSGAVCAAVYQIFCENKAAIDTDLPQLKKVLAQLESFFHGASSGIDPLVSYLQKGVWIKSKNDFELISEHHFSNTDASTGTLFLIDTQKSRQTAPLVEIFHQKYTSPHFQSQVQNKLIPITNEAISFLLNKQSSHVFDAFHQISHLQNDLFQEMIPPAFKNLWKEGVNSNTFKLKLCGAGGGGFILGYTLDFEQWKKEYPSFSTQSVLEV